LSLCIMVMSAYVVWLWFAGCQSTKLAWRGRHACRPKRFHASYSEHERDTETETKVTWNDL